MCKEPGLESLCDKRWYFKLVFFYKIVKYLVPSYLQSYFSPDNERTYNNSSSLRNTIKSFATQTSTLRVTFFLYCTKKWNQLNNDINKVESIKKLRKTLIKVIRTKENPIFGVSDIYGIKVLTRLRFNFSHLNEGKFRNNWYDKSYVELWRCYWNNYSLSCVTNFIYFKGWSSLMLHIN